MKMAFSFIELETVLMFGWFILAPILPSIIAVILGYFSLRRENKFFYYNLNFASIITTLFVFYVVYDLFYGALSKDAQGGVALVFLPFWTPFICFFSFVVSCFFYSIFKDDFFDIKRLYFKKYNALTFFISGFLLFFYLLVWGFILIYKIF